MPSEWEPIELPMRDAPALTSEDLEAALDRPVGAPALAALAASKTRAAIAVDDATRPTRTAPVVSRIVERLISAGMPAEAIIILVATGAHRAATPEDIRLKVGEVAGRVRVKSHDPEDVAETGVSLAGHPVRVSREFLAADLRITVGGVMPHPFAGFSGGGKIVLPGLSDLEAVVRSHKYALMGFAGGLQMNGNKFRSDMERAVRAIGVDWTVNVVLNSTCESAAIVAGDLVESHRAAVDRARDVGATAPPPRPLDALVLNAYPKDTEFLQIEAALVAVRAGMTDWLRPGAPIVLLGACPDGLGSHQLFGPGGRLFRKPGPKSYLGSHVLHVVSPAASAAGARAVFPDVYPCYETWDACVAALRPSLPSAPHVGFALSGPLHVPVAMERGA
jgi:nickel-dependent lactate racemase